MLFDRDLYGLDNNTGNNRTPLERTVTQAARQSGWSQSWISLQGRSTCGSILRPEAEPDSTDAMPQLPMTRTFIRRDFTRSCS